MTAITEKDIFNYVFYNDLLNETLKQEIKSNSSFAEVISLYQTLRDEIKNDLSIDIKRKLADKIDMYKFADIIKLFPIENKNINKMKGGLVHAAASEEDKPIVKSKTFIDENKSYMIKCMNYESKSKIFVFSVYDELIKDFSITIQPQNLHYKLDDNSMPLELDLAIDPESITLEFSLTHNH
jgi:hypothetical protein